MKRKLPIVALLALTSCSGVSDVYTAADRATFDAVAPEYSAYVQADAALDEASKATRLRTIETWRLRLDGAGGDK